MGQRGPCTLACGAGRDSGREKKPTGSRPRKLRRCMMVKVVETTIIDVQSLTLGKAPQPAQQGITEPDGSAPVVNVLRGISLILGNSTSARCHTRHCAPEHVHTTNHVSDGPRPQCLKNSAPRLDPPRYFQPKNSSRHAGPRKSSCSLPRFRDLGTCPQREAPSRRQRTSVPEAETRGQPK